VRQSNRRRERGDDSGGPEAEYAFVVPPNDNTHFPETVNDQDLPF